MTNIRHRARETILRMLCEMIWGEAIIDENAVMVYINRLRQKIEDAPSAPKYIQNVRGIGYRFVV